MARSAAATCGLNYGALLSPAYDTQGNRTSLQASFGGMTVVSNSYQYDDLNRLQWIKQSGSAVSDKRVDFTWDSAGRADTVTRYQSLGQTHLVAVSDYSFDGASRLRSLTHSKGATTLAAYTWTYDAASKLTAQTSPDGSVTYSYDAGGQLTGADYDTLGESGDTIPIIDRTGGFGRFSAWPDWRALSSLACRITSPSAGTAGSRPSFATTTTPHTWN
jgi:hypothetical protein